LQAGFFPVKVSAVAPEDIDLMLIPKEAGFDFRPARWTALQRSIRRGFRFSREVRRMIRPPKTGTRS